MNNFKEMINNFDYIRLEVVDAWQFPAVYIVYRDDYNFEDAQVDFFMRSLDKEEYADFIKKLNEIDVDGWMMDYLPERDEKIEEEYMWKLIVGQNGKKAVKKGKNKSPENFTELENIMIEMTYREDEVE